jgi:hypothetical protein
VARLRERGLRDVRFITPTALSYGSQDSSPNLAAVEELLTACKEGIGPDGRVYFGSFPSEIRRAVRLGVEEGFRVNVDMISRSPRSTGRPGGPPCPGTGAASASTPSGWRTPRAYPRPGRSRTLLPLAPPPRARAAPSCDEEA